MHGYVSLLGHFSSPSPPYLRHRKLEGVCVNVLNQSSHRYCNKAVAAANETTDISNQDGVSEKLAARHLKTLKFVLWIEAPGWSKRLCYGGHWWCSILDHEPWSQGTSAAKVWIEMADCIRDGKGLNQHGGQKSISDPVPILSRPKEKQEVLRFPIEAFHATSISTFWCTDRVCNIRIAIAVAEFPAFGRLHALISYLL